jgi:hypothetical protein
VLARTVIFLTPMNHRRGFQRIFATPIIAWVILLLSGSAAHAQPAATTEAPSRVEADVTLPTPILRTEPSYSKEGSKARIVGTVLLTFVVDKDGVPTNMRECTRLDWA